jgi:hypothetical protein
LRRWISVTRGIRRIFSARDIQRLPAHHAGNARGGGDFLDHGQTPFRRQADLLDARQQDEGFGQERVARENRQRFAENLVAVALPRRTSSLSMAGRSS